MSIQNEGNRLVNEHWNRPEVCEEYISRAVGRRTEWLEAALEEVVAGLEKSALIFEIGSGPGEEAKYLRRLGYKVAVSDVSEYFVDFLAQAGFEARLLDALTDEFPKNRDLIMAYFLFQFFEPEQTGLILAKTFRSLSPGGRFSLTTAGAKEGRAPSKGQDGPTGWYLWSEEDLSRLLEETGFRVVDISAHPGMRDLPWLSAFAEKPASVDAG